MVQAIDRAMDIVNLLMSEYSKTSWNITDIAENVGLPLSTTHRLISSLIKHELVVQLPETKQYKTGPKWMEIGLLQLEQVDLRTLARPVMEQMSYELKESIYLSIPNGLFSFAIERIDSPMKVRLVESLGDRIPMHIGAPNKTMLAFMDSDKAVEVIHELIQEEEKRNTLIDSLIEIRQKGFSISYGEYTEGTVSIAAPILGFGQIVVGALSIGVLNHELDEDRIQLLSNRVLQGAREITVKMGGG